MTTSNRGRYEVPPLRGTLPLPLYTSALQCPRRSDEQSRRLETEPGEYFCRMLGAPCSATESEQFCGKVKKELLGAGDERVKMRKYKGAPRQRAVGGAGRCLMRHEWLVCAPAARGAGAIRICGSEASCSVHSSAYATGERRVPAYLCVTAWNPCPRPAAGPSA